MENSLQITAPVSLPTKTLKTALPGLLTEVRQNGARNLVEASYESVVAALEAIVKDPVLSSFPFDQASFPEVVYRVIKSGTVLERAALAKHLNPKVACFFPPVERQAGKSFEALTAISDQVIKPMLSILCQHFGVTFNGDVDSVAYSIITEFGGLSVVDFLIFFERSKTGRYRQGFQHIASRGINAEFLFSWLEQYVQEKVADVDEMYLRFKNPTDRPKIDDATAEKIEKHKRERAEKIAKREPLISRAQQLRSEFEFSLYDSAVVVQGFKFITEEIDKVEDGRRVYDALDNPVKVRVRKEILCDADDPNVGRTEVLPYRIPKDGAIERLIKRAIFEFVTFGKSKETEVFFDEYKNRVWTKYRSEPEFEGMIAAEFKHLLTQVTKIKNSLRPEDLIRYSLEKTGRKGSPRQVENYIFETLRGFEDSYFDEYLPYCFRVNCPPMTKEEYFLSVLLEYVVSTGGPNPIKSLFE